MDPADPIRIFRDIWNFQLTAIDAQPITIGKLVVGLFVFAIGYYLLKKIKRMLELQLFAKTQLDVSYQKSLASFIFYFLLVFLSLFTLRLLNVPLTAFTILGGAVAIGVGFGSQNLVNNFLSGLILMIERPIRVGDFVELQGLSGIVEEIGSRATRIRNVDRTHWVVPNSTLLENHLLNWNLSDDVVRVSVSIGVAYGSPTNTVKELLLAAAKAHPKVLQDPQATVLFSDFGDNALIFELLFWTNVQTMLQRRLIASEMRFRIDALFREAKITIAFPQRDIHLDMNQPIAVEIRPSPSTEQR